MSCTRYYPLTSEEAPHRVVLYERPISQHMAITIEALRLHRVWLEAEENGTQGHFHDGGINWDCPDRGRMTAFLYRFTDEATAFYFKMKFG